MIVISNALVGTRTMNDAMDDAMNDARMDDDDDVKNTEADDAEEMDTDSVTGEDAEEWDDENDDYDDYGFGQECITRLDQSSLDTLRDEECCIRRVDLTEDYKPGDEGIVALCDALVQNTSVEELVLDGVGMGMRGVIALANLIRTSRTITEVHLSRDEIGDEGLFVLAAAIACNESVISLDLCQNGFTAKGARALAVALRKNSTISYVAIIGNDVGDEGAEAFALYGLLDRPTPLKGLSLMQCNVGDRGAVAIATSLQRKPSSLVSLCLASNFVGNRGAAAMADMLRYDRRLVDLSLENNRFCCHGIKELAWALLLNTTLRHARICPAGRYDKSGSEGWHFLEAVASHISSDDSCDDLVAESFVASLFAGTWRSPPGASDISIAQRNLEEGCFDRPLTVEGTAALGESSPRRGQRRLLRALCRAGLKHLGSFPALIPK